MNGNVPGSRETLESIWRLQKIILDTLDFTQVVQKIVDSVAIELGFLKLGYKIIVLALGDDDSKVLRRVSMSQTEAAEVTMNAGKMSFDQILIPYTNKENYCIQTYNDGQIRITSDWKDILTPPMTEEEARRLQSISGIRHSMVFPVNEGNKIVGVMIFSLIKDISEVSDMEKDLIRNFTDIVGMAIHDAKLYTDLAKAHDKLRELDKMKDEFISIASHELRSPAAVVKDYLWNVLDEGKDLTPEIRSDVEKAVVANQRLIGLVNDLLDVSRIEGGRLELNKTEFEMKLLVEEAVAESKVKAEAKGIKLLSELGEFKVMADREKIRQVVMNLLDNAIKYSAGEKTVTVKLVNNRVEVTDQGIGIDPAQQDKLFGKFSRLDTLSTAIGKVTGTGLGLYICKKIIELSGGEMGFESQYGQGTVFWFTLEAHE